MIINNKYKMKTHIMSFDVSIELDKTIPNALKIIFSEDNLLAFELDSKIYSNTFTFDARHIGFIYNEIVKNIENKNYGIMISGEQIILTILDVDFTLLLIKTSTANDIDNLCNSVNVCSLNNANLTVIGKLCYLGSMIDVIVPTNITEIELEFHDQYFVNYSHGMIHNNKVLITYVDAYPNGLNKLQYLNRLHINFNNMHNKETIEYNLNILNSSSIKF